MRKILLLLGVISGLAAFSVETFAQTVTLTVKNSFGQTINLDSYSCGGGTCSPAPPGSVANGTTSSGFGLTSASLPSVQVRYQAFKNGKYYGCQWMLGTGIIGSNCSSPSSSVSAYQGVYPSPTCTFFKAPVQEPYPSCNISVTGVMSP